MSESVINRLPVFVFPSSLNFYLDEPSTHKQVLTLYNPYDFVVQFRVMSTAPWKYQVVDPEGSIKPHCCIDLVVRHNALSNSHLQVTDKFRIHMSDMMTKHTVGKKDVLAVLLPGRMPSAQEATTSQDSDHFQQFPGHSTSSQTTDPGFRPSTALPKHDSSNAGSNVIAIIVGLVCVFALLLPQDESGSNITATFPFVKLSSHQKLVFAYTLGLVTMVILRV